MWRVTQTNEHFIIMATIILFCAIALGEVLPKECRAGNTFLNHKSKRLEVIMMFVLALCLSIFL